MKRAKIIAIISTIVVAATLSACGDEGSRTYNNTVNNSNQVPYEIFTQSDENGDCKIVTFVVNLNRSGSVAISCNWKEQP